MVDGYVAFLDVLGFASLVANKQERLNDYLECLQDALRSNDDSFGVQYVVFSDSIILTAQAPGSSFDPLLAILRTTSRLFGMMLEKEIALRGAISYGSYLRAERSPEKASSEIDEIRGAIARADRIVFLGFAFHRLNMDLLLPRIDGRPSRDNTQVFATASGDSESNIDNIRHDLVSRAGFRKAHLFIRDEKCIDLMREFSRSLAF